LILCFLVRATQVRRQGCFNNRLLGLEGSLDAVVLVACDLLRIHYSALKPKRGLTALRRSPAVNQIRIVTTALFCGLFGASSVG
jgi:hypothetical protein